MPADTTDGVILPHEGRAGQAAVLIAAHDGRTLRYLLATDAAALPARLPADTGLASLTLLELDWFTDDARLVVETFATGRWFDLSDVVSTVAFGAPARGAGRAARRRERGS